MSSVVHGGQASILLSHGSKVQLGGRIQGEIRQANPRRKEPSAIPKSQTPIANSQKHFLTRRQNPRRNQAGKRTRWAQMALALSSSAWAS